MILHLCPGTQEQQFSPKRPENKVKSKGKRVELGHKPWSPSRNYRASVTDQDRGGHSAYRGTSMRLGSKTTFLRLLSNYNVTNFEVLHANLAYQIQAYTQELAHFIVVKGTSQSGSSKADGKLREFVVLCSSPWGTTPSPPQNAGLEHTYSSQHVVKKGHNTN